ncbi:MAG: 50S ribosomal protein L31 [Bacilli bacterium]|nr:50S ribosomal protein L31 [Bacilli bacterium]
MKKGIHPEIKECKVTCACGNTFNTKSNKSEIQLETCNKCHSFYTGKFKTAKTGNVQKFKDKYGIE